MTANVDKKSVLLLTKIRTYRIFCSYFGLGKQLDRVKLCRVMRQYYLCSSSRVSFDLIKRLICCKFAVCFGLALFDIRLIDAISSFRETATSLFCQQFRNRTGVL